MKIKETNSREVVITNDKKNIEVSIEEVNGKQTLFLRDLELGGSSYLAEGSLVDFEDISLMIQRAVQKMAEAA